MVDDKKYFRLHLCRMHTVFLSLGSNEGDRKAWLEQGIKQIELTIGSVTRQSSMYQTAAWGKTDQPAFLNMVIKVASLCSPTEILELAQQIETKTGRQRTIKWGARTLDIDILFYDSLISNDVSLVLPHPFLHLRRFTLEPLNEIAPDFVHPALHQKISTLLATCPDLLPVKAIGPAED